MNRTRTELLSEVDSILHQKTFDKEASARAENLLRLADQLTDRGELRRATLQRRDVELGRQRPEVRTDADLEFRSYLRCSDSSVVRRMEREQRAQTTTTTAGGYLIPQSFSDRFESIMQASDGLVGLSTLFETSNGSATGYPLVEDTAQSAAVVAENSASATDQDLVFATVAFDKCPQWRTGLIRAPIELVNDSAFDFESLLVGAAAVRLARGLGTAFTATLLSSSTAGKTTASATAIASDEVFDLVDSIDPDYAMNASFLMRRSTLTYISKLKGTSGGSYLFPSETDASGRPLLLGYPVYFSPAMGAITTGQKSVSFGDHSKFLRRQVRNSLVVHSAVERFAEYAQVGYEVFLRADGALIKSGSNYPCKYLLQA